MPYAVNYKRAVARRQEIDAVYSHLKTSDVLIITLGLVECWFDKKTGLYLNRPARGVPNLKKSQTGLNSTVWVLNKAMITLNPRSTNWLRQGLKKIILTVSPVPLMRSFSGEDAVIANMYSKSVLRITAEHLAMTFRGGR